ncbi:hypothetical protein [Tritonibacter sp. SIMBA_163]|uniref:hypothetical protein n=1 Tax=Tritonibacter sp. SIMBA_163 TaxID=3080868 RepID=UPI00397EACD8
MTTSDEQLSFDFKSLPCAESSSEALGTVCTVPSSVVSLDQIRQQRYRLQVLEKVRQARIFDTSEIANDLLEG